MLVLDLTAVLFALLGSATPVVAIPYDHDGASFTYDELVDVAPGSTAESRALAAATSPTLAGAPGTAPQQPSAAAKSWRERRSVGSGDNLGPVRTQAAHPEFRGGWPFGKRLGGAETEQLLEERGFGTDSSDR